MIRHFGHHIFPLFNQSCDSTHWVIFGEFELTSQTPGFQLAEGIFDSYLSLGTSFKLPNLISFFQQIGIKQVNEE